MLRLRHGHGRWRRSGLHLRLDPLLLLLLLLLLRHYGLLWLRLRLQVHGRLRTGLQQWLSRSDSGRTSLPMLIGLLGLSLKSRGCRDIMRRIDGQLQISGRVHDRIDILFALAVDGRGTRGTRLRLLICLLRRDLFCG